MSDNHFQSAKDDIAYMRAMAQEGRHAPLLNGPIMVAAGVIFGAASVCQWAVASGTVVVSPWAQLWVWLAAGGAFAIALTVLIRRINTKPGCQSAGNKAVGAAWSAVGFGIFATWVAFMAVGYFNGDWSLMRAMPIIVFTAYGSAWTVAAMMSGVKWMNWTAIAAYAGAAVLGVFVNDPIGYLVFAALLVFVALLPGLALMRQEPAEVI
jgi:hypothetical protein